MSAAKKRLRPGELDGLVLAYLRKHEKDGPLTATGRSPEVSAVARPERSRTASGGCHADETCGKGISSRVDMSLPRHHGVVPSAAPNGFGAADGQPSAESDFCAASGLANTRVFIYIQPTLTMNSSLASYGE